MLCLCARRLSLYDALSLRRLPQQPDIFPLDCVVFSKSFLTPSPPSSVLQGVMSAAVTPRMEYSAPVPIAG